MWYDCKNETAIHQRPNNVFHTCVTNIIYNGTLK